MTDTRPPDKPDWLGATDAEATEARLAGDSPANHAVRRVVTLLREAAKIADDWTNTHAHNCECPYCAWLDRGKYDVFNSLYCVWQFCEVWADLLDGDALDTSAEAADAHPPGA